MNLEEFLVHSLHAVFARLLQISKSRQREPPFVGTGEGPNFAALTRQLKEAATIQVLLRKHHVHEKHLNHIHLSVCWNSLGRMARQAPSQRHCWQANSDAMQPLIQQTLQAAGSASLGVRQLATVFQGAVLCSQSQLMKQSHALFATLVAAVERRVTDSNMRDVANTAWALAKTGRSDAPLFYALGNAVGSSVIGPQDLSNIAWAFATACRHNASVFATFARTAVQLQDECNTQDLANTAWAFAKACYRDVPLFNALTRSAERQMQHFKEQELSSIA